MLNYNLLMIVLFKKDGIWLGIFLVIFDFVVRSK